MLGGGRTLGRAGGSSEGIKKKVGEGVWGISLGSAKSLAVPGEATGDHWEGLMQMMEAFRLAFDAPLPAHPLWPILKRHGL